MSQDKPKNQLHALLALDDGFRKRATAVIKEAIKTFTDRSGHFVETIRTFSKIDDSLPDLQDEHDPMVTTVDEKLNYVWDEINRSMDCGYQKEITNSTLNAHADIILEDGATIAFDIPATALLRIGHHLDEIYTLYTKIPTLAPGYSWTRDTQRNSIYSSPPKQSFRLKKKIVPVELSPSTEFHPAQVTSVNEDVPTYKVETTTSSGAWSPAQKSEALGRIDRLREAVKKARTVANRAAASKDTIASKINLYINTGKI